MAVFIIANIQNLTVPYLKSQNKVQVEKMFNHNPAVITSLCNVDCTGIQVLPICENIFRYLLEFNTIQELALLINSFTINTIFLILFCDSQIEELDWMFIQSFLNARFLSKI